MEELDSDSIENLCFAVYKSKSEKAQRFFSSFCKPFIADLPPELIAVGILEELEYDEILNLCSTSKQFRSLCKLPYVKEILKRKNNLVQRLLRRFPDKPWDWGKLGLSKNPSIKPEFVERNMDKPWDWGGLSWNPSITPGFVEINIDKPWYWGGGGLSSNHSITPEFVERHMDKPWGWGVDGLSSNSGNNRMPDFKICRKMNSFV